MDDASVQELLWNNNDQKVESQSYHFVAWKRGLELAEKKLWSEAKESAFKIEAIGGGCQKNRTNQSTEDQI